MSQPDVDLGILKKYCYRCRDRHRIRQAQKKYAIPYKMKYLLGTGDWPVRDLATALNAFGTFLRRYRISDLFFVWDILPSPERHDILRQSINHFAGIQYHLIQIGPVDKGDLAPLMGGAFGFVYPGTCCDDCLPILEALTCGCPVIYAETPMFSALMGSAGLRVSPGSEADFVRAYHQIYTDKKLRHTCIRQGLKRAEELMTLARHAARPPVESNRVRTQP